MVFHSEAFEEGQFALADVARHVHDKLVLRHPHVFGDVEANTAEDVNRNWEQIKRKKRARQDHGRRASRLGPSLCPQNPEESGLCRLRLEGAVGALPKIGEELGELSDAIAATGLVRQKRPWHLATRCGPGRAGGPVVRRSQRGPSSEGRPEAALREVMAKFRRRFMAVETLAAERGADLSQLDLGQLDLLWEEVAGRAGLSETLTLACNW